MNRIIKVCCASIAIVAAASAVAQDVEESDLAELEPGVIGWTPIAIGLATPVQLPFGIDRWDVFGLDLNLFYSDAPLMYGLDIGGFAALTRRTMMGAQVAGLANIAIEDVYGLRATAGLNFSRSSVYGCEVGLAGVRDVFYGLDVNLLGALDRQIWGVQISGLVNVSVEESHGLTLAGVANLTKAAYGCQAAIFFNMTEELNGCQIGLVNFTKMCPSGFQIGLVNVIMQNQWKVLPFVNGYF